jgi:hypothetical protein
MPGYGTACDPKTLLEAMRDKALADGTKLNALGPEGVKIVHAFDKRTLEPSIRMLLMWTGSPEEPDFGESGADHLIVATHQVDILCCVYTTRPDSEETIVGGGNNVGLAQLVANVLDFYDNNFLGLGSSLGQRGPIIQLPENSVGVESIDEQDENFMATALLKYEARTRPFRRARVA